MEYSHSLLSVTWLFITTFLISVKSWEYGVAMQNKILFFNKNWEDVSSAAHRFGDITALAYDEISNIVYFNDRVNDVGNIFSLELSEDDDNHKTNTLVQKTGDEIVEGMAYDPLERALYWTDSSHGRIYKLILNGSNTGEAEILLNLNGTKPHGIAIDICRRKLYWTNMQYRRQTIERSSLDGSNREIIISEKLFKPTGIVVDQHSDRIFWVDDKEGNAFSINSATLNGDNITAHTFNDRNQSPFSLVVDETSIYWTDQENNNIMMADKLDPKKENNVKALESMPKGIMIKSKFLDNDGITDSCKDIVENIRLRISSDNIEKFHIHNNRECSGNGNFSTISGKCSCIPGFIGSRCDVSSCFNYCINGESSVIDGSCHCKCQEDFEGERCEKKKCDNYCLDGTSFISSQGHCACKCNTGFSGERCEKFACDNYCFHNNECKLEYGAPICLCSDKFSGLRCENIENKNTLCQDFCRYGITISHIDYSSICNDCETFNHTGLSSIEENLVSTFGKQSDDEPFARCPYYYKTIVVVSVCFVIALLILYLIIAVVRKMYKPIRPRIKKTYKINTPLTCRPDRSEQCEITIENCCNMNICDTPCFDPKTLEEVAREGRKEDKKHLLKNMEI